VLAVEWPRVGIRVCQILTPEASLLHCPRKDTIAMMTTPSPPRNQGYQTARYVQDCMHACMYV